MKNKQMEAETKSKKNTDHCVFSFFFPLRDERKNNVKFLYTTEREKK